MTVGKDLALALCCACATLFRRAFGERFSRGTCDSIPTARNELSLMNPGEETLGDGLLEEKDRSACCFKDIPVTLSLTKTPRI